MITAILTTLVVWLLFYGRIPAAVLLPVCIAPGIGLALLRNHEHTHFLSIDILAQTSRLNKVSPSLKFWTCLALMTLCIWSSSPLVGIVLAFLMLMLTVFAGGLKLHDYAYLMSLPVSFLMISGLALLVEVTKQRAGVLGIPVSGFWLCVSAQAQVRAALVMARALGSLSCLYMLSLTTPMSELIGFFRRIHCPGILIDLMYLIYRYIFILLTMHHTVQSAAKSRLGYTNLSTSLRTTGGVYSNMLARSYMQANRNFDAMESRCFDANIQFFESKKQTPGIYIVFAAAIVSFTLILTLLFR